MNDFITRLIENTQHYSLAIGPSIINETSFNLDDEMPIPVDDTLPQFNEANDANEMPVPVDDVLPQITKKNAINVKQTTSLNIPTNNNEKNDANEMLVPADEVLPRLNETNMINVNQPTPLNTSTNNDKASDAEEMPVPVDNVLPQITKKNAINVNQPTPLNTSTNNDKASDAEEMPVPVDNVLSQITKKNAINVNQPTPLNTSTNNDKANNTEEMPILIDEVLPRLNRTNTISVKQSTDSEETSDTNNFRSDKQQKIVEPPEPLVSPEAIKTATMIHKPKSQRSNFQMSKASAEQRQRPLTEAKTIADVNLSDKKNYQNETIFSKKNNIDKKNTIDYQALLKPNILDSRLHNKMESKTPSVAINNSKRDDNIIKNKMQPSIVAQQRHKYPLADSSTDNKKSIDKNVRVSIGRLEVQINKQQKPAIPTVRQHLSTKSSLISLNEHLQYRSRGYNE